MSGQTVGISDTFNHSRFFPPNAYGGEIMSEKHLPLRVLCDGFLAVRYLSICWNCLSLHPHHFNPIFDGDDLHPLTLRKRGFNRLYIFVRQFHGLFHTLFYHNTHDCQGLCVFKMNFRNTLEFAFVALYGVSKHMFRLYASARA